MTYIIQDADDCNTYFVNLDNDEVEWGCFNYAMEFNTKDQAEEYIIQNNLEDCNVVSFGDEVEYQKVTNVARVWTKEEMEQFVGLSAWGENRRSEDPNEQPVIREIDNGLAYADVGSVFIWLFEKDDEGDPINEVIARLPIEGIKTQWLARTILNGLPQDIDRKGTIKLGAELILEHYEGTKQKES